MKREGDNKSPFLIDQHKIITPRIPAFQQKL